MSDVRSCRWLIVFSRTETTLVAARNQEDLPHDPPVPDCPTRLPAADRHCCRQFGRHPGLCRRRRLQRGAPQPHGSPGNGCQCLPVVPFSPEQLGGAFHQLHFRRRGGLHGAHRAQACPPVRCPASDHEPDLGRDHRGARQATGSRHRAVPPRRTAGRGRHPQRRPPRRNSTRSGRRRSSASGACWPGGFPASTPN